MALPLVGIVLVPIGPRRVARVPHAVKRLKNRQPLRRRAVFLSAQSDTIVPAGMMGASVAKSLIHRR